MLFLAFEVKNGNPPARTRGRPSKHSEATVKWLCDALADGMPIKGACVVAGIGVTTLREWRDQHPQLEVRIDEARELARQKALQEIKAAGEKDWRAWRDWLHLAFPSDYRGSASKIEVTAMALASSGVVLTEEERMQLIQRREKALLAEAEADKEEPA